MNSAALELSESRLASRLAGRLAERAQTQALPVSGRMVAWMDFVDLCRELDECLVSEESPSQQTLALHASIIKLAISVGESLIPEAAAAGSEVSAFGETLETLTASLELLRIFYRSRHPQLSPGEVDSLRQRIFNAAA